MAHSGGAWLQQTQKGEQRALFFVGERSRVVRRLVVPQRVVANAQGLEHLLQ